MLLLLAYGTTFCERDLMQTFVATSDFSFFSIPMCEKTNSGFNFNVVSISCLLTSFFRGDKDVEWKWNAGRNSSASVSILLSLPMSWRWKELRWMSTLRRIEKLVNQQDRQPNKFSHIFIAMTFRGSSTYRNVFLRPMKWVTFSKRMNSTRNRLVRSTPSPNKNFRRFHFFDSSTQILKLFRVCTTQEKKQKTKNRCHF